MDEEKDVYPKVDIGNAGNTCSDSSDSEITKAKIIRKFKRKLMQRKACSDSDSESDIFRKRYKHDMPKYYEGASQQNQLGNKDVQDLIFNMDNSTDSR